MSYVMLKILPLKYLKDEIVMLEQTSYDRNFLIQRFDPQSFENVCSSPLC